MDNGQFHHDLFGALRLVQFLPDAQVAELRDWEFREHVWIGEAIGFSEWVRLEDEPDVLRSLAIDFGKFPKSAAEEVLRAIDLPIQGGMTFEQLRAILGDPNETEQFVADRVTYEFFSKGPHPCGDGSAWRMHCITRSASCEVAESNL